MALVSFSWILSAEQKRPHFAQNAPQEILNDILGIVNSGFNIAMNEDDPEAQFNAGLGIANSLGSMIFHLARSIDPEDLRSMTEDEITQELIKIGVHKGLQKKLTRHKLNASAQASDLTNQN